MLQVSSIFLSIISTSTNFHYIKVTFATFVIFIPAFF
jgi:hypothetical protein